MPRPPGLAFGEPDDRLQRSIQYVAASRLLLCARWPPARRAGDGLRREWLAMAARSAAQRLGREIGGGSGHGAGVPALAAADGP